jgi:hypothetical protein
MTRIEAQWLTLAVIIGVTAAVLSYDAWVIRWYGPDASISRVVAHLGARWPVLLPVLAFALGVMVGHVILPAE